jgi:integrase
LDSSAKTSLRATTTQSTRRSAVVNKEALAEQPAQQEPVAWRTYTGRGYYIIDATLEEAQKNWPDREHQPLYTTPPPVAEPHKRKPLSEEEIGAILEDVNAYGTRLYTFARAIEAAHGIKENT